MHYLVALILKRAVTILKKVAHIYQGELILWEAIDHGPPLCGRCRTLTPLEPRKAKRKLGAGMPPFALARNVLRGAKGDTCFGAAAEDFVVIAEPPLREMNFCQWSVISCNLRKTSFGP